jgi:hypothetical protein
MLLRLLNGSTLLDTVRAGEDCVSLQGVVVSVKGGSPVMI